MGSWPTYTDNSWKNRQPLKYRMGNEPAENLVVSSDAVDANDDGRRLVSAATLLCEIESGDDAGKYGPYDKTADDGRQTLTPGKTFVTLNGRDMTLGDFGMAGLWQGCVFNTSDILDANDITDTEVNREALASVFPKSTI